MIPLARETGLAPEQLEVAPEPPGVVPPEQPRVAPPLEPPRVVPPSELPRVVPPPEPPKVVPLAEPARMDPLSEPMQLVPPPGADRGHPPAHEAAPALCSKVAPTKNQCQESLGIVRNQLAPTSASSQIFDYTFPEESGPLLALLPFFTDEDNPGALTINAGRPQ